MNANKRQLNTITVGELIELLQDQDPEAKVAFSSDYGDHCHTQQVLTISGDVNSEALYESAYSDSGFSVVKDSNDEDDAANADEDAEAVLIIS